MARSRLAIAAAYAVLAASLAASGLTTRGRAGSWPELQLDPRLLAIAVLSVTALIIPLFMEGFKELFRQVFKRGRRRTLWQLLFAALLQLALIVSLFILLVGILSRYAPRQLETPAAPFEHPDTAEAQPESTGQPAEGDAMELVSGGEKKWAASGEALAFSWLVWAIAGVVLTLVTVAVVYAAVDAWLEHRSSRTEGTRSDAYEEELLEATREALQEVEEGRDPRRAIVSYFLKLCKLLREQGAEVSEDMTAREITAAALQRFQKLNPDPLGRLVELFEEARYSDHHVDEGMRREALACFAAIRDSLAGGDVEG